MPSSRPTSAAAMMPPTGPDSIMATGIFLAVSGDMMPPLDCMMCSWPLKPIEPSRSSSCCR